MLTAKPFTRFSQSLGQQLSLLMRIVILDGIFYLLSEDCLIDAV